MPGPFRLRPNMTKGPGDEVVEALRIFLLTALQIWYYCGHVIRVRTIKCQKFNCQLILTKSHKVWWLNYRPF